MKKFILIITIIVSSFTIDAQVGVGTTSPESALDIVSTNSGVIIPRITNTTAVTTPVNGMLIYDLSANCFKGYENDGWSDCLSAIGASSSVTDDCDQNGFEGAYVGGIALGSSNDYTVTITNNSFNTVPLSLNVSDLVLSGTAIGSVSVASVSPTSVSLTAGQSQVVTY